MKSFLVAASAFMVGVALTLAGGTLYLKANPVKPRQFVVVISPTGAVYGEANEDARVFDAIRGMGAPDDKPVTRQNSFPKTLPKPSAKGTLEL